MEFYTINDIAELFKVSYKTASALVHSDGFPKLIIGKSVRVPKSELDIWIKKYSYKNFNL